MSFRTKAKLMFEMAKLEGVKKLNDLRVKPRDILTDPNFLHQPCVPWTDFSTDGQLKLMKMIHVMAKSLEAVKYGEKLGLAANQVGYLHRVFIANGKVYINPVLYPSKAPKILGTEGCYSVPNRTFTVERSPYGHIHYTGFDGKEHEEKVNGIEWVVLQHEYDHLEGKLCSEQAIKP